MAYTHLDPLHAGQARGVVETLPHVVAGVVGRRALNTPGEVVHDRSEGILQGEGEKRIRLNQKVA